MLSRWATLDRDDVLVRVLVRGESQLTGPLPRRIEMVRGHLLEGEALERLVEGADVCVHLAAQVAAAERETYSLVNVEGTRRLLEALSRRAPRCRLLHCSSVAALNADELPAWASTPYAKSKAAAEVLVRSCPRHVVVVPGLIFGPGDTRVVPALGEVLLAAKPLALGAFSRPAPLSFVDDLVELFTRLAFAPAAQGLRVSGYLPVPGGMEKVLQVLAEVLKAPPPRAVKLPRLSMLALGYALEKIHRTLELGKRPPFTLRMADVLSLPEPRVRLDDNGVGWCHRTSLREALEKSVSWCRAQGVWAGPGGKTEV